MIYEQTTDNVRIAVQPFYAEDQSEPEENRYVFGYKVRIENHSDATVRLLRRYWRITDALGRTTEVEGEGVVGEQPALGPGEAFEYVSGAPLTTPSGMMAGHYQMTRADGTSFAAAIPAFSLDLPGTAHIVH